MAVFADQACAVRMVAGLPALARAVRTLAQAGYDRAVLVAPGLTQVDPRITAELERLAGAMAWQVCADPAKLPAMAGAVQVVAGETLMGDVAPTLGSASVLDATTIAQTALTPADGVARLNAAARAIIKGTAKPGDGIVSRHLNRPVSQAITRLVLRLFPHVRPVHGTFGTAALALAMTLALLSGTQWGLVTGALLFQAASIFDGVDGEIARATVRSSPQGAAMDSLVDALTNLACVAGVAWNLYLQGYTSAALAGAVGLGLMGIGLTVLGYRSRKDADGMTFNAVKERFSQRPSRTKQWLTWLTMRDFYAFAGAVLIASGFAAFALYAFATVVVGWLVVVLAVMTREAA